ncbi:methyl-accepting chemotaxis protein [Sphingomonas yabuuchiae]|uniref:HAMP domain-containing protein n=1 Tax=Sphingomonas yabuuchiae TaxID=172044 RepID=A0AA41A1S1_9SPHN|nr:methyl-accepting chemotaxis protein [Sphingomonas yabuuchiae]MBB4609107.1 methyl-accepting chemotaxis protein [Sphingomonas yabuuchiae]MBN3559269.1 HAMP domain-containing protein [Sphingomonas yabuuchiae]
MFIKSVAARLIAPVLVSMLLLAILSAVTLQTEGRVARANQDAAHAEAVMLRLAELRSLSRSLQRDALNLVIESDPAERKVIQGKFDTRLGKFADQLGTLQGDAARYAITPAYFTSQARVRRELTEVGRLAGTGDRAAGLSHFRQRVRPAERLASRIADARIDALTDEVKALHVRADTVAEQGRWILIGATLLLAIAGLATGLYMALRTVVRPLHELRQAMGQLAEGQTERAIPHAEREDEVGEMARSMVAFRDQLARAEADKTAQTQLIVASIGQGLSALAKGDLTARIDARLDEPFARLKNDFNTAMAALHATMARVVGATSGVRAGAMDIRQASDDLSQRTEQQAASLEETAAAMDEITATVRHAATGASDAALALEQTCADARDGGAVVVRARAAMVDIERASSEIEEIIGVIDGIAFQTNLLALNAGVEAARAGEAGRGFAVVASEVRALAQRSADAARDVKQRVLASASGVQNGVALVGETGVALEKINEGMGRLGTLMTGIADDANRQAKGLGEVNTSLSQMDMVTQQNAAMVEQATAAARSLAEEAEQLSQAVERFVLDMPPAPLRVVESVKERVVPLPVRRAANEDWSAF